MDAELHVTVIFLAPAGFAAEPHIPADRRTNVRIWGSLKGYNAAAK